MQTLLADPKSEVVAYKAGEKVKGTVVDADDFRVLLELPGGVTGIITRREINFEVDGAEFAPGAQVEALIINEEDDNGLVVLSLRQISHELVWSELGSFVQDERIVKVRIEEANKGGLMASYKGIKAFLPVSQLTPLNYPRVDGADSSVILNKLQSHVGKDFAVRVINVDREAGKVIISEKAAHQDSAKETLQDLNVGEEVTGEVSGIVKFGIFVTFGGVEGLVHLSELDWGHVSDPSKMFSLGNKVKVKVIGIDGEKLSLSVKQLTNDPWLDFVKNYKEGDTVEGKVTRWNTQGVFIEITSDVQGFFPLEQFDTTDHTTLKIKEGEVKAGKITAINTDSHRLELALA